MSRKLLAAIGIAMVFLVIVRNSDADTLLGKDYIGGSFTIIHFGDDSLDDLFGNAYGFDALGNINLSTNIDLQLGLGYYWAEGSVLGVDVDYTAVIAAADIIYFFKPNEQINPYVGAGLAIVRTKVEVSGPVGSADDDDTEVGFGCQAGVELEVTKKILCDFSLSYFNIDSEDDVNINAGIGYWFNDRWMGFLGATYAFDYEDATATLGLLREM